MQKIKKFIWHIKPIYSLCTEFNKSKPRIASPLNGLERTMILGNKVPIVKI